MANQNSYRSRTYHLVIEEYDKENDKHLTLEDLQKCCNEDLKIKFYAFIKHDKDVDVRVHYHIVLLLNQTYSKSTIIHSFASSLLCNVDIISCRKIKSFVGSINYLIHKGIEDKYQYNYFDIYTNDDNELNSCMLLGASTYELDIDYLYQLCKHYDSLSDIYKCLGLELSKKYRSLILDMYNEEHFRF